MTPKTDFEKLQVARQYVRHLERKVELQKKEINSLTEKLKKDKEIISNMLRLDKKERDDLRKNPVIQQAKQEASTFKKRNQSLRKTNDLLVEKIVSKVKSDFDILDELRGMIEEGATLIELRDKFKVIRR